MKKLGLVGGMGPESTIPYYHDIVYGVQKKANEKLFPLLTIESVDVFKVLGLCNEKRYDELVCYLMTAINNLVKSGADFIALAANTPHIVFESLQSKTPVPMISIVDATCREAKNRSYKKIGLLGTVFTMKEDFFKKPFIKQNIEIVTPNDNEMEYVNRKISSELELGIIKEDTLDGFKKIISRMKREENIEAVVLGCTELPLLLNDSVSPLPCLDTMKIHVEAIVNKIMEK